MKTIVETSTKHNLTMEISKNENLAMEISAYACCCRLREPADVLLDIAVAFLRIDGDGSVVYFLRPRFGDGLIGRVAPALSGL